MISRDKVMGNSVTVFFGVIAKLEIGDADLSLTNRKLQVPDDTSHESKHLFNWASFLHPGLAYVCGHGHRLLLVGGRWNSPRAVGNVGSAEDLYWDGNRGNVLALTEEPVKGTPQSYVAWITGLKDGDTVDGDTTSKARIWGHYTYEDRIDAYAGSASGNNTYSDSITEWETPSKRWYFSSAGRKGVRTDLVVEARIYTYSGQTTNTLYVDDVQATVTTDTPEDTVITFPSAVVPEPASLFFVLFGLSSAWLFAPRSRQA